MLDNLPTIRVITLEESLDRRRNFTRQIVKYTNNYKFIPFKRFEKGNFSIKGDWIQTLHRNSYGSITSHLYNLYDWYHTCEDDYCIVMEDDASFITLNYWKFTFKEFIDALPKEWEAVQLVFMGEDLQEPTFRNRTWYDWCAVAFIMKRTYVKKLIEQHVISPTIFTVTLKDSCAHLKPIPETIFFDETNKNVYMFPLFVEDVINCGSTYKGNELIMDGTQGPLHNSSYEFIVNWWKNNNIDLKRIFK